MKNTGMPKVTFYKREGKFYWMIKSQGYDDLSQAVDSVPDSEVLVESRENNKGYNGTIQLKTKGDQTNDGGKKGGKV